MSEEIIYEKEVHAEIISNPEFYIPEPDPGEIMIAEISTLRDVIFDIGKSLIEGEGADIRMLRAGVTAAGSLPFTAIDIILSAPEEGLLQATVTAVGATGASIAFGVAVTTGFGAVAATGAGLVVVSVLSGAVNYLTGKLLDGAWDYVEDKMLDAKYNEETKDLELNTGFNDLKDTKRFTDSFYHSNKSEGFADNIKVKQNNGSGDTTYEIKDGDTIWDICEKYGMSYDDLIDANDWLEDRFSDDKDFALIRPGEKLKIPDDFVKPDGSDDGDDDGSGSGSGHDNDDFFNEFNPDGKNDRWRDTFDGATTVEPIYLDPLLVDLNGDGIKTTDIHNGTYFDHDNNSFAEKTAWVSSDDGILVFDKNNDGIINNGNEVFGDNFTKADGSKASSGFDALASLDSNNDGVINSGDEMFNSIKILKGDGTLMTLSEAGITSISLASSESGTVDENGNTQLRISSFTKADGSTGEIGDYSFVRDPFYSVSTDVVDVPQDIQALPDASGYGFVQSLRQAMAKDASGELKALVQSFIAETNLTQKREILTNIIYKWAGTDTLEADSRGGFVDARALSALEKFSAKEYTGIPSQGSSEVHNPNEQAANIVNAAFSSFRETVYAQLASQTSLKSLFDLITFEVDIDSQELSLNLNDVTNYIKNQISLDKQSGDNLLSDFDRVFKNLGLTSNSNYQEYYDEFVSLDSSYKSLLDTSDKFVTYGTDENDSMTGSAIDEAFFGGSGDDTIYSRQGNDIVYGGDGDDYIDTCEGDDIVYGGNNYIDGGAGNDTIYAGGTGQSTIIGGLGDDILHAHSGNSRGNITTFIYNLGDGNDVIIPYVNECILSLGEGITRENIRFEAQNSADVKISFENAEGSITLQNWLNRQEDLSKIILSDGSMVSFSDIVNNLQIHGSEADDTIEGTSRNEKIYGYGGNDIINAGGGDDTIYGGAGNDTITSSGGSNVIYGDEGNDTISIDGRGTSTITGGAGDDEIYGYNDDYSVTNYVYNLGDGSDTIYNRGGTTVLNLGEGITKDNIRFTESGNDVLITFVDQPGSITVKDGMEYSMFTNINFADGTSYSKDEIMSRTALYGTEGNDVINASNRTQVIYGLGGDDIINGRWGDNTIYGGNGNDTINGVDGSNYLDGGAGNDTIYAGEDGQSILIGGLGDDILHGQSRNTYGSSQTTYIYNSGDGNDTIFNGCNQHLCFGEGISKDNIVFSAENDKLKITFTDREGSITINEGMYSWNAFIEFSFADGTSYTGLEAIDLANQSTVSNSQVNQIIQDMTAYSNSNDIQISNIQTQQNNTDLLTLVAPGINS